MESVEHGVVTNRFLKQREIETGVVCELIHLFWEGMGLGIGFRVQDTKPGGPRPPPHPEEELK